MVTDVWEPLVGYPPDDNRAGCEDLAVGDVIKTIYGPVWVNDVRTDFFFCWRVEWERGQWWWWGNTIKIPFNKRFNFRVLGQYPDVRYEP